MPIFGIWVLAARRGALGHQLTILGIEVEMDNPARFVFHLLRDGLQDWVKLALVFFPV